MSLPSRAASVSGVCLRDKGDIVFSDAKNCSIFRGFFSNIAQSLGLVSGLSPSAGVFAGSGFVSCFTDWAFWGFWPFPSCVCVWVCVCWGGVWTVSKVSPSEVYPPRKLRWHFTCGFDLGHDLWLPFEAAFAVLKGLNPYKSACLGPLSNW